MNALLRKLDIKSPNTGNELSDAMEFNLMFGTFIGPTGTNKGWEIMHLIFCEVHFNEK